MKQYISIVIFCVVNTCCTTETTYKNVKEKELKKSRNKAISNRTDYCFADTNSLAEAIYVQLTPKERKELNIYSAEDLKQQTLATIREDKQVKEYLQDTASGKKGDLIVVLALSKTTKRPVYLYNSEGKLWNRHNINFKGPIVHLQYAKNASDGSNYWRIPEGLKDMDNIKVMYSGPSNSLYNAWLAQMRPEEHKKLNITSGEDLRKTTLEILRDNPGFVKDMLEWCERTRLEKNIDILWEG